MLICLLENHTASGPLHLLASSPCLIQPPLCRTCRLAARHARITEARQGSPLALRTSRTNANLNSLLTACCTSVGGGDHGSICFLVAGGLSFLGRQCCGHHCCPSISMSRRVHALFDQVGSVVASGHADSLRRRADQA